MDIREKVAKALCKRYDEQAREDGHIGSALAAYNAGVDMTINFWNSMADIALAIVEKPYSGPRC
jgi:hypothetical protein